MNNFIFLYIENISKQASDGLYETLCDVNITIRDVNNHAPQFSRDNYMASIAENTPIGKYFYNTFAYSTF